MQYIVSIPVPDDALIVESGRIRLSPKHPEISRRAQYKEMLDLTNAIKERFPEVKVITIRATFALISTTEDTAAAIRDQFCCNVEMTR